MKKHKINKVINKTPSNLWVFLHFNKLLDMHDNNIDDFPIPENIFGSG